MTIKFEPGTVYDVAHLRPFNLGLALAGHPLARSDGCSIRLFRFAAEKQIAYDVYDYAHAQWDFTRYSVANIWHYVRLAPLAVKDGRGLHVGDEIEASFEKDANKWHRFTVDARYFDVATPVAWDWRWPND